MEICIQPIFREVKIYCDLKRRKFRVTFPNVFTSFFIKYSVVI